ncbi:MAG: D-alanyl-D-alanine carboxypeptidase family protein [Clostridia bacterium]|nr:D-alanyl-D-alanine carboxypeptidase family protein [Clostridia bacterium]
MRNKAIGCLIIFLAALIVGLYFVGPSVRDKLFTTQVASEDTITTTRQSTTNETTTAATTVSQTQTTTHIQQVVTTTAPQNSVYTEKEENVWATRDVNIRAKPTTNSKQVGKLHEGNKILRLAKGTDGWSRVMFEGEVCYIYSEYLTTTEPFKVSSNRTVIDPTGEDWNLVVVNTKREIPADYVPKLAEVASSGVYMDYRVAPYYNAMYEAAKKDGIILTPYSGYRSYARQQRNYNNLTQQYMTQYSLSKEDAAAKAATVILPPGTSEHNLGLAMDICNTNSTFKNQKEYKWLTEHAHEYGFILRYTAEKQPITGIIPEPWHWRFVGVEYAEKIKNSGLCLEEYLGIE